MYVFDARFLTLVTPLNFAYYSKYVLEEIFIVPILAILQKSSKLGRIDSLVHSFEWPHVQFKEFPSPNGKAPSTTCASSPFQPTPFQLNPRDSGNISRV